MFLRSPDSRSNRMAICTPLGQRAQGLRPMSQVGLALFLGFVLPCMVGRHVHLARAPRDCHPARHLTSHSLSCRAWSALPPLAKLPAARSMSFSKSSSVYCATPGWPAQASQLDALVLDVLSPRRLDVGALQCVQNVEKRRDRDLMMTQVVFLGKEEQPSNRYPRRR